MTETKTHVAQQFSPWSIARTVWKGRWIVLAAWIVLSVAGVIIVRALPTVYVSSALILVDSQKIPERFVSSTVSTQLQDRIAAISQQILSAGQLGKIITDFGLYRKERNTMVQEEIIEKMRKDIDIKAEKSGYANNKPGAFHVSYQGSSPTVVAAVANRLVEVFINENLKSRENQAEGTSEFLESQLAEAKRTLDAMEASIGDYKQKHNGELPQQESALASTQVRLQGELTATRDAISRGNDQKLMQESSLATAEATLQALQDQAAADAARPVIPLQTASGRVVTTDPYAGTTRMVAAAPRKSDTLRAQYEALRVRYKDDHPDVKKLKADLARAEEQEKTQDEVALAAVRAAAAKLPEVPKPPDASAPAPAPAPATQAVQTAVTKENPQLMQLRDRIRTVKMEMELNARDIEKRKATEQRLLASIADVQARIDKLPLREQEMAVLMRDYGISKENYQRLLANKLSAGMSKDMELRQKAEKFTVVDPPTVPERPAKPNRPAMMAGFSGGGFFLGIVLAFIFEFRRDVLLGEWELPEGVTVLGTLPRLYDYTAAGGPTKSGGGFFRKRMVVNATVVGVLAALAIGAYLVRNRF